MRQLSLVGTTALGRLPDDAACSTADSGMLPSRCEIAEPTLCIMLAAGHSRCRHLTAADYTRPALHRRLGCSSLFALFLCHKPAPAVDTK
jgi:hypothetical protein